MESACQVELDAAQTHAHRRRQERHRLLCCRPGCLNLRNLLKPAVGYSPQQQKLTGFRDQTQRNFASESLKAFRTKSLRRTEVCHSVPSTRSPKPPARRRESAASGLLSPCVVVQDCEIVAEPDAYRREFRFVAGRLLDTLVQSMTAELYFALTRGNTGTWRSSTSSQKRKSRRQPVSAVSATLCMNSSELCRTQLALACLTAIPFKKSMPRFVAGNWHRRFC